MLDLDSKIKLSLQRALLGMIYPAIRGVAYSYKDLAELTITYYLDRLPVDSDYENLSDVAGEFVADTEFITVNELCEFIKGSLPKLDTLKGWVYIRKED